MEILEDTKNKKEDEKFVKTVIIITLLCSFPIFYILDKWVFGEKEELQNKTQITSDAQAIKSKDITGLMHFGEYRPLRKVVETNEAQLKAIEELVHKLSLEIKELQKQNGKKNEN